MPWLDAEKIMREKEIPLYSLEYLEPVANADWLGFSMQYELQYANLINILDLAGIPFYSKDRTNEHPILIAGGPSMANPEPIAPFIDVFFPGDGEETIVNFCTELEKLKKSGASREEKLRAFSKLPGAYVPALYETEQINGFTVPIIDDEHPVVLASKIKEFRDEDSPQKQVVPMVSVVHHRMAVEVMRGCTRGCRFCAAGYYDRPVRERPVKQVTDQIRAGIESTGWNDVGLMSLSTADYSRFGELLCSIGEEVGRSGVKVSLPSTRIDAVTETEFRLLNKLSPASSLTIAPEAGSQRLRNVINKDFSRETIIEMVHALMKNHINTLKLYFMVGLPTETEEDIDELIDLVNEISNIVWAVEKRRKVSVSLSPFSPKSHTAFQWEALCDSDTILSRSKRVKNTLRKKRNVKIDYRDPRMTFLETILTRGDRSLAPLIVAAWKDGSRFEGWNEQFYLARWLEQAEKLGIDLTPYHSAIEDDQPFPWQAVSMGLSTKFLKLERNKAYKEATSVDCRNNNCIGCNVCDDLLDMKYSEGGDASEIENITENLTREHGHRDSGERFFIRLRYAKRDSVRFLSHRNVVDVLERAFSAAKVPIAKSEGYKPRPRISYGPPLPLAATGNSELLDMIVLDTPEIPIEKIKSFLPDGLEILSTDTLPTKPSALSAVINAGHWRIEPIIPLEESDLQARVDKFLGEESVIVRVPKKKGDVDLDIRNGVHAISVKDGAIEGVLRMAPGPSCRPADLIVGIFEEFSRYDFRILRINGVHIDESNETHLV